MDEYTEAGVFLSLNDCKILYPRFKEKESYLSEEERKVFLRIEKILYESFSILEMEELLERCSAKPGTSGRV